MEEESVEGKERRRSGTRKKRRRRMRRGWGMIREKQRREGRAAAT